MIGENFKTVLNESEDIRATLDQYRDYLITKKTGIIKMISEHYSFIN